MFDVQVHITIIKTQNKPTCYTCHYPLTRVSARYAKKAKASFPYRVYTQSNLHGITVTAEGKRKTNFCPGDPASWRSSPLTGQYTGQRTAMGSTRSQVHFCVAFPAFLCHACRLKNRNNFDLERSKN